MSIKSNLTENLKNANEESSVSLLQAYCNSRITDSKESKDSNYYKKFFFDVKNIIFPENDKNIKTSIRTQLIDRIKILLEEKTENLKKENGENEENEIKYLKKKKKKMKKMKRKNLLTKKKLIIKENHIKKYF